MGAYWNDENSDGTEISPEVNRSNPRLQRRVSTSKLQINKNTQEKERITEETEEERIERLKHEKNEKIHDIILKIGFGMGVALCILGLATSFILTFFNN